ncbi:VOC family protein [Salinirubrum litoreum]|uniref:VOC family protein n=1 Tax=Salinirubrum litoreum TaxID=1126234 RepID=A0ABD5R7I5_9EURY|nr:VOC family protein [Salinirubrum litoreum]
MPPHLGHVHLKVRDVDRAVEFYTDLLGLSITERHANFAFLSFGEHHHDLALQGLGGASASASAGTSAADRGGDGDASGRSRVGLYHTAFEVESPAELRAVFDRLIEREVRVSPVDHRISKALYFDDPDGNGVEVYLDTRAETGQDDWHGENRRFDPATLGV